VSAPASYPYFPRFALNRFATAVAWGMVALGDRSGSGVGDVVDAEVLADRLDRVVVVVESVIAASVATRVSIRVRHRVARAAPRSAVAQRSRRSVIKKNREGVGP